MNLISLSPILSLPLLITMASAAPIELGSPAPAVTALTDEGTPLNVGDVLKSGYTLVYFYPRADTSGCTAQGCSLRDAYEELTARGVRVIGVSIDPVDVQKAFKDKYSLPFTLLADTDKEVLGAFGVPQNPRGMASRQAFLFKDGRLVWRDLKASTSEQAADVLAAVESLK